VSGATTTTRLANLLTIDNSRLQHLKISLVGAKEVAALLGVSRQRVDKIAQTHSDFPKPLGEIAAGRIWQRGDVLAWVRRTRQNRLKTKATGRDGQAR
jgi:prophage regulatory protein